MKLTGIKDLISFLQYLQDISKAPWYRLYSSRYDALMVEVDIVGIRLEVEFFDDHVEYSVFEGDESVLDDQQRLFALIDTAKG
jgi:hypothetical protein